MLNKEEELRLADIGSMIRAEIEGKEEFSLTLETISWLAEKTKELQAELKNQPQLVCDGNERHTHFQLNTSTYVTHRHPHESRRIHFNNLHHHPPMDHRKPRE